MAYSTQPKAQRAPLASHPLFGTMVMIWFAALFSLSVVAIEGATLEHWVLLLRIDEILPAAAPPLGAKARLLAAVAMGLLGAGLGWVVARIMRPSLPVDGEEFQLRQRDRHPDAPARRPISAHEELGDEGLGRASSAWDDMSAYRAEPKNYEPEIYAQHSFETPSYATRESDIFAAQPFIPPLQHSAPLDEAEPALTAPISMAAEQVETPAPQADDLDLYDLPMIDLGDGVDTPVSAEPVLAATPDETASEEAQEEAFDEGWHALPPVVSDSDLPPVAGPRVTIPSILPKIGAVPLRAVEPVAPPKAPAKPVAETPALIGATPVHPRASAGERINQASLGDLSHVELIERLAMAIHSREKKNAPPVAVNDLQDPVSPSGEDDEAGDRPAAQASLRSALANLREVK